MYRVEVMIDHADHDSRIRAYDYPDEDGSMDDMEAAARALNQATADARLNGGLPPRPGTTHIGAAGSGRAGYTIAIQVFEREMLADASDETPVRP